MLSRPATTSSRRASRSWADTPRLHPAIRASVRQGLRAPARPTQRLHTRPRYPPGGAAAASLWSSEPQRVRRRLADRPTVGSVDRPDTAGRDMPVWARAGSNRAGRDWAGPDRASPNRRAVGNRRRGAAPPSVVRGTGLSRPDSVRGSESVAVVSDASGWLGLREPGRWWRGSCPRPCARADRQPMAWQRSERSPRGGRRAYVPMADLVMRAPEEA